MKKIILIVVGIIILAVLGRFGWAYLQIKPNNTTKINSAIVSPEAPASNLIVSEDAKLKAMRKWSVNGADYVRFKVGESADKLAIDTNGNLYVSNIKNQSVARITPEGIVTVIFNSNSIPWVLAVDAFDNLYVACEDTNIYKITAKGVVTTFAKVGTNPRSLAFDTVGNLYVGNTGTSAKSHIGLFGGISTISKITPLGVVTTFATLGEGIAAPNAMIFGPDGNLYAANALRGTISKITPAGTVTTFMKENNGPFDMAFDAEGNLYTTNTVADWDVLSSDIIKIEPTGATSTLAKVSGNATAITLDLSGNLYTVSSNSDVVSKITKSGIISTFATVGRVGPMALAFDMAGNLFVANRDIGAVDKFAPTYHH